MMDVFHGRVVAGMNGGFGKYIKETTSGERGEKIEPRLGNHWTECV